jgi:pteridine reductase
MREIYRKCNNQFYNQNMVIDQYAGLPHEKRFPLALVTGAAHRLGKSFAMCLARMGYAIVLHYNNSADKAFSAAEELSGFDVPIFPVKADLTNDLEINSMFLEIDSLLSRKDLNLSELRVLVNSAAIMERVDVKNLSSFDFDKTMNLNLKAPFFCAQMAFQRMTNGGVILNISDIAAQKTWTSYPIYSLSKAGLEAMTKLLARSFAPKVRVNSIAPGLVLSSETMPEEEWLRLVGRLPLRRSASIDELTAAMEFLLKNEYITGQTLVVDGGYSLL